MAANIRGHKTVLGVFPAHTDWSCRFKKRCPQKGCGAALAGKSLHSRARMFLFERVPAARPRGVTQLHDGNWLPEHWKGKGPGPLEPLGGASELKVCSSHLCGEPFSPWCRVNEDSGAWEGCNPQGTWWAGNLSQRWNDSPESGICGAGQAEWKLRQDFYVMVLRLNSFFLFACITLLQIDWKGGRL